MESRAPAVVAVVVTTGPGPGLEATLASLVVQDYAQLSLLVVANGDAASVTSRVAAVAPSAFVRVLEENRGFAGACNEASLMVEGSAFFLFCHDDVRLEPDAVQQMVESAFRTNAGIVTPKVVAYDDPLVLLHVGQACDRFGVVQERVELGEIDHGQQDLERDVFVAPGGVTLVRSDLFVTIRGFDPTIPTLGEDLDLCWRAQIAGARIVVAPSAKIAHRETIATGERPLGALGTRRTSRQELQRRHQLLVVATGWGRRNTLITLSLLMVMDTMELAIAVLGRDHDRASAIVGSWRWLLKNRKRVVDRRRERLAIRVLSDAELRRLQIGGASRLKRFVATLLREGLDRARGIVPPVEVAPLDEGSDSGVGFAAAFSEDEEFDYLAASDATQRHAPPTRLLTGFRAQAAAVVGVVVLWSLGSRNLLAMHLPLVGRLAPLDSWWTTWRHFFSSWSPNGVGTGAPGMPGYGVLGVAGTFVLGRMGILPRLVLIGAVPVGAFGVARLLQGRVSNRARLVASIGYLALPLGLNMIGQGRTDVLVVVGSLPFITRRLFAQLTVPGFDAAFSAHSVSFGRRGWRSTRAGQRMVSALLIALSTALAPATLVVVALLVLGVTLARYFERDHEVPSARPWRILASTFTAVSLLLGPLSVDVATAGRRALEVFGLARGPWSAPSFAQLARGADGAFGMSWPGWLLPAAALTGYVLCRTERRTLATKLLTIATLTLIVATLDARHWLGGFAPDLDVLLALYMLMVALLIGLGVSAMELDLRQAGFGWRQVLAGIMVAALSLAAVPLLASFASGRFDLPTASTAESLNALAPPNSSGYRVLWLADPSVAPLAGWSVAPGLEVATSTNGLPGGSTLFTPPGAGVSAVLVTAVQLALQGRTVRLGQLLAPAGIATIVVMNAPSPNVPSDQSAAFRAVPAALVPALRRQSDLSVELQTNSVDVFSNAMFHGLVSESSPTYRAPWTPELNGTFAPGHLTSDATVIAGFAPAGYFTLVVNGHALARTTSYGWVPTFHVGGPRGQLLRGQLSMHHFPLNGFLATLTLGLWIAVLAGFGSLERISGLFIRRRRTAPPRHALKSHDG